MKKFIITEGERERILNLHKTRSSNQYLMEQPEEEGMKDPIQQDPEPRSEDTIQYLKEKLGWKYESTDIAGTKFETLISPNANLSIVHYFDEDYNHHLQLINNTKDEIIKDLKNTKENADKILNYVKSN